MRGGIEAAFSIDALQTNRPSNSDTTHTQLGLRGTIDCSLMQNPPENESLTENIDVLNRKQFS